MAIDILEVKTEYLSFITVNKQTIKNLAEKLTETFKELNKKHTNMFQLPFFHIDSKETSLSTFDFKVFEDKLEESFDSLYLVEMNIKRLNQETAGLEEVVIRIAKRFEYSPKDPYNSITIHGSDSTWVRGKMDLFRSTLARRANRNKFFHNLLFRAAGQLSAVILMLFASIKLGHYITGFLPYLDQSWPVVLIVLLLCSNIWAFVQVPLFKWIGQWKPTVGFGEITDNNWKVTILLGSIGSLIATAIWWFANFFLKK